MNMYTKLLALVFLVECVRCNYHMIVVDEMHARTRRDVSDDSVELLPDITDFNIISTVNARFATVNMNSHVTNQQSKSLDTAFIVQIPETAFIANFSMIINGNVYIAKVFAKEEAQKKYDEAKSKNQSAGQISHAKTDVRRGMDIFKVDVNVASFTDVTFYLTYQELLERRLGKYKQRIVINPGQIVKNVTVTTIIKEVQGFESFSYQLPNYNIEMTSSSSLATLTASVGTRTLVYAPSEQDQTASSATKGLNGELIVSYDLHHKQDGGIIFLEDDYFVHYVTPSGLSPMDKNILFVIDVSGSMGGNKIVQTRESMMFILDHLNSNDYFNILIFSGRVKSWKEVPIVANSVNVARGKQYVTDYVNAGGSTNINDALIDAIRSLRRHSEETARRTQAIVLLTDGEPSAGETNTKMIRKNVYKANDGLAAIYCLGFGHNLDFKFLKNLALENGGFARRIYEEGDATKQLENFYLEIKDPVLKNVVINYGSGVVHMQTTTKTKFAQYFKGSEIVVVGKTTSPNVLPSREIAVSGISRNGIVENLPIEETSVIVWNKDKSGFTEKLWAYKKIKELIDIASINDDGEASGLALNMSLKYNFVTPLTSFFIAQSSEYSSNQEDEMSQDTKRIMHSGRYPKLTVHLDGYPTAIGGAVKPWFALSAAIAIVDLLLNHY